MACRRLLVLGTALLAVLLVRPPSPALGADEDADVDEALLKKNGIGPTGPSLLAFFRQRSLADADRDRLELLVRQLGDKSFSRRMQAKKDLISIGLPALRFLKPALTDPDLEIVRLVKECLPAIEIKKGSGPSLPAAAARVLAKCRPAGAVAALLLYVPYMDDEWAEEEIFTSLGSLAVTDGEVDAALLAALKDPVARRRAAAAFLLGQLAGPDRRAAVRHMLADPDALVRRYAAEGLIGKETFRQGMDESSADLALLKDNKVPTDTAGLLEFLRKRSLTAADRRRIQSWVAQLEDRAYATRAQAAASLIDTGSPTLPFLRPALASSDPEVVARARKCMDAIEKGPGTALPVAALRLIVARSPAEAVKSLLAYAPSADDEFVEEAVLEGLCSLAVRRDEVDPALSAALDDALPPRRAAASYVLARVGTAAHCRAVAMRLRDPNPKVRVRAAQGLLFAKERAGLPLLVEILGAKNPDLVALAERILRQVAGNYAPDTSILDAEPDLRKKIQADWASWWQDRGTKIDLATLVHQTAERGLTVVCEFDGTPKGKGQVWEFGRDFKPRWLIENLEGPMDAHMLSADRVLIAEYYSMRITERDLKGDIKWEHRVSSHPVACGRLSNGNIFIATYTNLVEVTHQHKVVYDYNRGVDGQIYSAQKLPNGHIVYMTGLGNVVEMDGATGKEIHKFNVGYPGAWCGVEWLSNGRYLVCLMANGKVMEVDSRGRPSWEMMIAGAHQTLRLRNGHVMIACMNNKRLVEIDRAAKKIVWERPIVGRPWRMHRR